nr:hypothetical protein Iba_chr10fCG7060 [Ipomoea batatas]
MCLVHNTCWVPRFIVPLRPLVNDRSDVLHQEAASLMAAAAILYLVEGSRTEPRTEREVSNDLAGGGSGCCEGVADLCL